ncbi:MAG: FtsW/RodA/SpoVE family cell cycle protein, partial [Flavobacteriales bacterium]
GIPLPFFSYGGASLLGTTLLVFILLRLDAERFLVLR